MNAGDTQNPVLTSTGLRFNAGMSKVFSLICDDFVIYDSRVAAALGWAVVKFCGRNGRPIPPELRFPWAPAKEGPNQFAPKRRNPSEGLQKFPRLTSGPVHAEWNLRASWLLKAVVDRQCASNAKSNPEGRAFNGLRELEAALFMIGYDLSTSVSRTPVSIPAAERAEEFPAAIADAAGNGWTDCQTLANGRCFRYRITANTIEVENQRQFLDHDVNKMLTLLWDRFDKKPFPLANSATDVRARTAPMGLGTVYSDATGKNPPDTSKLAAILEELGAIVRVESPPTRGLHWTINVVALGNIQAGSAVDIRPFLNDFLDREEAA